MTPTVEPTPRWIRVRSGGELIADSRRALLLIQYAGPDRLPTYYLPLADVRADALDQASTSELPDLAGHVTFSWDAVDWYEEDEQVHVHARDPHKRVDVIRSSRHVRVDVGGHTLAETRQPSLLFETWLPTRYYIPRDDVAETCWNPATRPAAAPTRGRHGTGRPRSATASSRTSSGAIPTRSPRTLGSPTCSASSTSVSTSSSTGSRRSGRPRRGPRASAFSTWRRCSSC